MLRVLDRRQARDPLLLFLFQPLGLGYEIPVTDLTFDDAQRGVWRRAILFCSSGIVDSCIYLFSAALMHGIAVVCRSHWISKYLPVSGQYCLLSRTGLGPRQEGPLLTPC